MIRWNCMVCKGKLHSRKEKILKTCNGCALQAKKVINNQGYSEVVKFMTLKNMVDGGKLSTKEKKQIKKDLLDSKKQPQIFDRWRTEQLSVQDIQEELESIKLLSVEKIKKIQTQYQTYING